VPRKSSSSRSRSRRKRKKESGTATQEKTNKKTTRRTRRRREINLDAWIEKHIDEFVSSTSLDLLNLSREQYIEILKDIIIQLYGSTSSYTKVEVLVKRFQRYSDRIYPVIAARIASLLDKLSEDQLEFVILNIGDEILKDIIIQLYGSTSSYTKVDVLVKRFQRYSDRIYPVIAARIASLLDKLSEDQLEFVVLNIGDEILSLASKLYEYAKKFNRDDLISILKTKWSNAWVKRRTEVLPAECPKCGFNALMPDLTCLVCNSVVNDKSFKEFIKFTDGLKELISILSCDELREIMRRGYVLVNGLGLKPPNSERSPVDIEVYLTSKEMELVKEVYKDRCEGIM